jgi:hypothetical protein
MATSSDGYAAPSAVCRFQSQIEIVNASDRALAGGPQVTRAHAVTAAPSNPPSTACAKAGGSSVESSERSVFVRTWR